MTSQFTVILEIDAATRVSLIAVKTPPCSVYHFCMQNSFPKILNM